MKKTIATLVAVSGLLAPTLTTAQELPAAEIYQQMLEMNKQTGWVAFRNYDGKQWIYFTSLVTLHCRLSEIRYSINSQDLDQVFPLPVCNKALPFSMPSDATMDTIAIVLPHGTVETISVQVTLYGDKRDNQIMTYHPCKNVGDASCAVLLEDSSAN